MASSYRCGWFVAVMLMTCCTADADQLTGMTYTYDLSQPDPFNGSFTTNHALADDVDDMTDLVHATSFGRLVDGDTGPGAITNPAVGCCLYSNGSYAGFRNDGAGGTPKLKIDVDLQGFFGLTSFTLHYLVNDRPAIYGPQPIKTAAGDIQFNAVTVSGSQDGINFLPLAHSNEFTPVFGPGGDFGTDAQEVRAVTIPLVGTVASHISIDIRTPWSFLFVSEFEVEGSLVATSGDFDFDDDVDGEDFLIWQRGLGVTHDQADLTDWIANYGHDGTAPLTAAPEPGTCALFTLAMMLTIGSREMRQSKRLRVSQKSRSMRGD